MDNIPNKAQELQERTQKEQNIRYKNYMGLLSSVFNTDNGKKLLTSWEKAYFYSPGFEPNQSDHNIYIREGENRFLRRILIDLNHHKNIAEKGDL